MTKKFFSTKTLIKGIDAAILYNIADQHLWKVLKSGKLKAYRPIMDLTPSNRNNVPPGLSKLQRYSELTDDEIENLDRHDAMELYFKRKDIVLQSADQGNIKQEGPHRASTSRAIYKSAADRAVTLIKDYARHDILPNTRQKKLNMFKDDKQFQKIIASLPQRVGDSTLIRRLQEERKGIWKLGHKSDKESKRHHHQKFRPKSCF